MDLLNNILRFFATIGETSQFSVEAYTGPFTFNDKELFTFFHDTAQVQSSLGYLTKDYVYVSDFSGDDSPTIVLVAKRLEETVWYLTCYFNRQENKLTGDKYIMKGGIWRDRQGRSYKVPQKVRSFVYEGTVRLTPDECSSLRTFVHRTPCELTCLVTKCPLNVFFDKVKYVQEAAFPQIHSGEENNVLEMKTNRDNLKLQLTEKQNKQNFFFKNLPLQNEILEIQTNIRVLEDQIDKFRYTSPATILANTFLEYLQHLVIELPDEREVLKEEILHVDRQIAQAQEKMKAEEEKIKITQANIDNISSTIEQLVHDKQNLIERLHST